MLCPVLWASPGGFLLVMRAAVPLSEMMSPKEYQEAFEKWDYMPGEDGCPFEPKESDWGWLKGAPRRARLFHASVGQRLAARQIAPVAPPVRFRRQAVEVGRR
jgi:hypothetical protein